MNDPAYYARRLAAEMFLDMEAPDLLTEFASLYRQRTGRDPSDAELATASAVIDARTFGFVDPPASASGVAYKVPDLLVFDPYEK